MIYIDSREDFINQTQKYYLTSYIDWTCNKCGTVHTLEEKRNVLRRTFICPCYKLQDQIQTIQNQLAKVNYEFLYSEPNSYTPGKDGIQINTVKPILVKCLNCNKISYEFKHNLLDQHKKCNCNPDKKYTQKLTVSEFLDKWTEYNKDHWTLLSDEYINRNTTYQIKCNQCGKEDTRWGLSLISSDLKCKYCMILSLGEQKIQDFLEHNSIKYIREYEVIINNHVHFFDFYLPIQNIYIEFNGEQHYRSVSRFGGYTRFLYQQERDQEKIDWCQQNNNKLIILKFDDTDEQIKEILQQNIIS